MAEYYSIITNRGKELEAKALASGSQIILTQFVVGDSNGKPLKPDPAQTQLVNETYRGDIAELVVSPEQPTQLMARIVLPTGTGGFTVREVGLMTDGGNCMPWRTARRLTNRLAVSASICSSGSLYLTPQTSR